MAEHDDTIIRVEHLSKLYGVNKSEAAKMMEEGATKDEVYRKTGVTVALWDVVDHIKDPPLAFRQIDHCCGKINDLHRDVPALKILKFLNDVFLISTESV